MGTAFCFTCGIIVAAVFVAALVFCVVKTMREDAKKDSGKDNKAE